MRIQLYFSDPKKDHIVFYSGTLSSEAELLEYYQSQYSDLFMISIL